MAILILLTSVLLGVLVVSRGTEAKSISYANEATQIQLERIPTYIDTEQSIVYTEISDKQAIENQLMERNKEIERLRNMDLLDYNVKLQPTYDGYTERDLFCMTVVIYQELGGDEASNIGRTMVGNVVQNRIKSGRFDYATDIESTITGYGQYGTLYKTGVKLPDRASSAIEQGAVERAEQVAIRVLEGLRLLPDNIVFQAEFEQGDFTYIYIDGQYFCGLYE